MNIINPALIKRPVFLSDTFGYAS